MSKSFFSKKGLWPADLNRELATLGQREALSIIAVEYWDAPDSATARAYGLVKALVTGDTDALGEHRKLDVNEE